MVEGVDVHMRASDAFTWYMERDPLLRSTVVVVLVFDRAPDHDLLQGKAELASRVVPGLRHRIVEMPLRMAPPRWTVDPDFDLSFHVRTIEAPPPKTLATLLDLARIAGMAGFDRARPLWEWTVVDGLEGGRAAVVIKIHHSLTDGVGGMQLAATLFDLEPESPHPGPVPEPPEPEHLSTPGLVVDALGYQWRQFAGAARHGVTALAGDAWRDARHPVRWARRALETAGSVARTVRPLTDTRSPVMTARKLGWHYDVLDVPLDGLKRAAKAAGGTLNDAFVGGVAGGLRRYHQRHGTSCPELRLTLPINIRHENDPAGGNRITLMRFMVPVGIVDPVERMHAVHDRTGEARAESSIPLTNAVAGALNLFPSAFVGSMLKHVDFLASNVPGLPVPLYVGNAQLERFYAFGPTLGAALNVTLLSYRETCGIAVNTDTGAVPDPETLMDCLREDFEEILDLGGEHETTSLPAHAS